MRVLVACEYSQVVTTAFRARGHDAYSCDIIDTLGCEEYHYKRDVRQILSASWDVMIAHPPCTYLANSGVRWLYNKDKSRNEERWKNMRAGAEFFKLLLECGIPRICIENPIMHKHAKAIIGQDCTHSFQPWQHGHGYTKRTCLWLKNLPKLEPSNVVEGRSAIMHNLPPSKDRGHIRSLTPDGVGKAMAEQWGDM